MTLKPGDVYTSTRDGKVFLAQYTTLSGFASVTRVLGPDPEADRAELDALVDRLWHESALANFRATNKAYEALGPDGDVDRLIEYLERKSNGVAEETSEVQTPSTGSGVIRKRKLK